MSLCNVHKILEYTNTVDTDEESKNTNSSSSTVPSNSKIAICVSGGLRSFYRPIVHTSLLQNFVNSLEPDENKRDIFLRYRTSSIVSILK
jgi:hypothetical protein